MDELDWSRVSDSPTAHSSVSRVVADSASLWALALLDVGSPRTMFVEPHRVWLLIQIQSGARRRPEDSEIRCVPMSAVESVRRERPRGIGGDDCTRLRRTTLSVGVQGDQVISGDAGCKSLAFESFGLRDEVRRSNRQGHVRTHSVFHGRWRSNAATGYLERRPKWSASKRRHGSLPQMRGEDKVATWSVQPCGSENRGPQDGARLHTVPVLRLRRVIWDVGTHNRLG